MTSRYTSLFTVIITLLMCSACKDSADDRKTGVESAPGARPETKVHVYIGTYTRKEGHVDGKAGGIHHLLFDQGDGTLLRLGETDGPTNPSYLALKPNGRTLYAVSEVVGEDSDAGEIHALMMQGNGELIPLSGFPTGGNAPCHVSTDQTGKYVFVANYVGGVIKMYRSYETGRLVELDEQRTFGSGPHPEQSGPHPHGVFVSPDNRFLYVPDKGSDAIWSYQIDKANGQMTPTTQIKAPVEQGAGPRHMAFHPSGIYTYVLNELTCSLTAFDVDTASGRLSPFQTISALRNEDGDSWAAAIRLHPQGNFLYSSVRGENTIAAFAIDPENGMLRLLDHVKTNGMIPRDFNIDPSGNYILVANQDSDNISVFQIDQQTGLLTDLRYSFEVATPVCIAFGGSNS